MAEEYWYRYRDTLYASTTVSEWGDALPGRTWVKLELDTYQVTSHTPEGVWLDIPFSGRRWVSLTTRRRYAHPTKAEALEAFIHRKQRQIDILSSRLAQAKHASQLSEAEKNRLQLSEEL